jgi:hypothetical protein
VLARLCAEVLLSGLNLRSENLCGAPDSFCRTVGTGDTASVSDRPGPWSGHWRQTGRRVTDRLGIQTCRTTILRRIMALPTLPVEHVSELGIDDFSFRRGRNFGTILVDMQSHQTIDLLPDRKKETAAAWMSAHPEIDAGRVEIAAATMLLRQPVVLPKLSSVRTGSTC